jgi:hypothetical protein
MKIPLSAPRLSSTRRSKISRSIQGVLLKFTQIYEFVAGWFVGTTGPVVRNSLVLHPEQILMAEAGIRTLSPGAETPNQLRNNAAALS